MLINVLSLCYYCFCCYYYCFAAASRNLLIVASIDSLHIEEKGVDGLTKVGILSQKNNDTIKKILQQPEEIDKKEVADFGYKSIS